MKKTLLSIAALVCATLSANATDGTVETTTATITEIMTSGTEGAFYFKIDNTTISGNRYYYFTDSTVTGTQAGCT